MVDFQSSQTRLNLLRAFAGESQAYMRYQYAAGACKQLKLYVLEATFQFTAAQEKEHAEVFWKLIGGVKGEHLSLSADYPVFNPPDPLALLEEARQNEFDEHDAVYPGFAQLATQEGFPDVAQKFTSIAAIEKTHGERFQRFAQLLKDDQLFKADAGAHWMCLNCGHIVNGPGAPAICPVCNHQQGYFIRAELVPFV